LKSALLHHVSLVTAMLDQSIAFYRDVLGFSQIERPKFKTTGAWLALGATEIHLIANAQGTFRKAPTIDTGDTHFALRVEDFEATVSDLAAKGYSEAAAEGDPKKLVLRRSGPAGYPQAYVRDPDFHIVEINAAR